MKLITISSALLMSLSTSYCQSIKNPEQINAPSSVVHKAEVEEVLQTSQYTYMHVKEKEEVQWLAVPKMTAVIGETYYYTNGLMMTDFESKELKRKFVSVIFLDKISTTPDITNDEIPATTPHNRDVVNDQGAGANTKTRSTAVKQDVKIEHAQGEIAISEIFKNKQSYSGKTIKIKGVVTKFSPEIMSKNWIHIQDGTDNLGNFDLTVTIQEEVKTGEIITLEGIIALDKDFGFGYTYDVIMENAKIIK